MGLFYIGSQYHSKPTATYPTGIPSPWPFVSLSEYWSDDSQARIRALREHLEIDCLEREYRAAVRDLWE